MRSTGRENDHDPDGNRELREGSLRPTPEDAPGEHKGSTPRPAESKRRRLSRDCAPNRGEERSQTPLRAEADDIEGRVEIGRRTDSGVRPRRVVDHDGRLGGDPGLQLQLRIGTQLVQLDREELRGLGIEDETRP